MAENDGYGKRPMWQWVLIYVVVGAVVYGIIYYFVLAKKGGSNPYSGGSSAPSTQQAPSTQTAPRLPGY